MNDPRPPVDWRRRLAASAGKAFIWATIVFVMLVARGLVHHAFPGVFRPTSLAWDAVRVPLGMFAIVFAGCFALGLAGVNVFNVRFLNRYKRVAWIAWLSLTAVLVVILVVISLGR